jgi:hypothetical protein
MNLQKIRALLRQGTLRLARAAIGDQVRYRTEWRIRKYASDEDYADLQHYSEEVVDGNLMLNEGIGEMLDLLIGAGSPTTFANASAYIGVGDSNAVESASQTDLQAATNKTYKAMAASYPSRSGQTVTWRAVFAAADANYAWAEFTIANASSGTGKNLNRKVSAQGTKTSGQTWTVDLAITWS